MKLRINSLNRVIILVLATLFVGQALTEGLADKKLLIAKSSTGIEIDRAEFLLRLNDSLLQSRHPALMPHSAISWQQLDEDMVGEVQRLLQRAWRDSPQDPLIIAKTIIFLQYWQRDSHYYLEQLQHLALPSAHNWAHLLALIYSNQVMTKSQVLAASLDIKRLLPPGWFQDHALIKLYEKGQDEQALENIREQCSARNHLLLVKVILLSILGLALLIGGVIVLTSELIHLVTNRLPVPKKHQIASPVDCSWLTVYSVFIAWLVTQLIVGSIAQPFIHLLRLNRQSVLELAAITAIIYVISNGSALFYIYFFVLRPRQLNFRNALKLTNDQAWLPGKQLVLAGVLAWLAALPIMLVAYYISAEYLALSGSSNPVIAFVIEVARRENALASLLFYLIVAVFAPVIEEILFRGFLYPYLRRSWGVGLAVLGSSSLFALAHLDPGGFLPLFCLGCIFAWLVEKTNSVLPAMIAHGLWNGATLTMVLLLFGN